MPAGLPEDTRWLYLSAAADYLGVHFTTLRRWTDEGKVPYSRTPGGRRRYRPTDLTAFLQSLHQGESLQESGPRQAPLLAALLPPSHLGISAQPWYGRLNEAERSAMRFEGQQLMAVLLQYATRRSGGKAFLREGERLAALHGEVSCQSGLTLRETLAAFLLVRRSISDSLHRAGALTGVPDVDTQYLYERVTTFLDAMLLATVSGFEQGQALTLTPTNPAPSQN